jgi:hypothetical protein
MGADIDAVAAALAVAVQDYQGGQYLVAQSKLEAVKAQVNGVKAQIEAAIAALKK